MRVGTYPRLRFNALHPVAMVDNLWEHRDLIAQLTLREISQRYRGSYLGILWSLLTPTLLLLVYTFVFSVVFRSRWDSTSTETPLGEFALITFAGLIPFNLFSEVANRAPTLIVTAPNYVKKVVFPLEVLPVVAVGTALVQSLISIVVLLAGALVLLRVVSVTLILLPLAYVPLILLALAAGWFLASLGVYLRDIGQVIGLVMQVLFFLSPIFYPVSAVPDRLRFALYLNPLTTILSGFRRTLLNGAGLAWEPWAAWVVVTGMSAWVAYVWFIKTKKGFADVM